MQGIAQGFCRIGAGRVIPRPLPAAIVSAANDLYAAEGVTETGGRRVKVNGFEMPPHFPQGLLALKALTEVRQGEAAHFLTQGKAGSVIGRGKRVVVKAHGFFLKV